MRKWRNEWHAILVDVIHVNGFRWDAWWLKPLITSLDVDLSATQRILDMLIQLRNLLHENICMCEQHDNWQLRKNRFP